MYISEFSLTLEEDIMDRTKDSVQTLLLALQKVRGNFYIVFNCSYFSVLLAIKSHIKQTYDKTESCTWGHFI